MMITIRSVILVTLKLVLSLFGLIFITVIVHEGAHYITALILGIPIASFTWFDLNYFAPVFVSGSTDNVAGMTIVSYAGGLVTGALLLIILILKRSWFNQSLYRWVLGFFFAIFSLYQLCLGVFEGAFHDKYISEANDIFSSVHLICYASAFFGMALYWFFMPRLKQLKI